MYDTSIDVLLIFTASLIPLIFQWDSDIGSWGIVFFHWFLSPCPSKLIFPDWVHILAMVFLSIPYLLPVSPVHTFGQSLVDYARCVMGCPLILWVYTQVFQGQVRLHCCRDALTLIGSTYGIEIMMGESSFFLSASFLLLGFFGVLLHWSNARNSV